MSVASCFLMITFYVTNVCQLFWKPPATGLATGSQLVGDWSPTGSHCLATGSRLVADQSPDDYLHVETGIFFAKSRILLGERGEIKPARSAARTQRT